MAQKPETVFKSKVQKDLSSLKNTWFTKIQQQTIVGTPDFIGCINTRFFAIELKTDEGKLSKLQEYNLAQIKNAGGISIVTMPSIWQDTFQFLKKISEDN